MSGFEVRALDATTWPKRHRRQGVAAAALDGALREIARLGGGTGIIRAAQGRYGG